MDRNIGVFVDTISLHKNCRYIHNAKLDYRKYLDRVALEGNIYRAFAYGTQVNNEAKKFISCLKMLGFDVRYVPPKKDDPYMLIKSVCRNFKLEENDPIIESLKKKMGEGEGYNIFQTDVTIDMIIDVMRVVHKLDIVVIGSNNPNIIPLIEFLKERGIKVIIFASNIQMELRDVTHIWWEITDDMLEIRKEEEEQKEVTV